MVLVYRAFGHRPSGQRRAMGIGQWASGNGHWQRENDKNTFPITDYPCPMPHSL
ncbi:MAG: hypothetical protein KME22_06815 [Hassallia sp. WJT32-NPBG1]|nr:hypothetical protein [Hassallia sp. WJT32-NPBG1]